jgi:hypothetical protein
MRRLLRVIGGRLGHQRTGVTIAMDTRGPVTDARANGDYRPVLTLSYARIACVVPIIAAALR